MLFYIINTRLSRRLSAAFFLHMGFFSGVLVRLSGERLRLALTNREYPAICPDAVPAVVPYPA